MSKNEKIGPKFFFSTPQKDIVVEMEKCEGKIIKWERRSDFKNCLRSRVKTNLEKKSQSGTLFSFIQFPTPTA
jgi:hypothetical protein